MIRTFEHVTEGLLTGEVIDETAEMLTIRLTEPGGQFDAGNVVTLQTDRVEEREYDGEVPSTLDEE